MPSLSKLTRLSSKVLQKTLKLEPRQHYGPDEPDNLVFMSPSVALKDEQLRHGGPLKHEIGAKECLSRVTRTILETKDVTLFEVPEITATHLGYGKKAENKEGRRAITKGEAEHWLRMLDFKTNSQQVPESGDTDLTLEYVQKQLSGLKIEEQGRFHLFFSILLIYFDKNVNPRDERKAAVGPNKISDFLIFWTLPYLLNFSHRKVQEIMKHGIRERGEDYSVETVKVCAEDIIECACRQMADQGDHLLAVFKEVLKGSKPLTEEYELLAVDELPIIFVPMEYQVTKMPAHIKDLGSKATWDKLVHAKLLDQFLEVFVADNEVQKDFFHALLGLEDRQGIDYAIVLPDSQTYKDFVEVIKEERPDAFSEQPRSFHCQGIQAERAVVRGSKTNFTVCFSYLQGSDNASIAQLFRAIGSHYLNHFTVIILDGEICNSLDSYQCGDLHPVSKVMKFVKKAGKMVPANKMKTGGKGTLVYPLKCGGGKGLFTQIDFPVTYLKWENTVKDDPIISEKGLTPQYRHDDPLCIAFFRSINKEDAGLPLRGPGWARTLEELQMFEYRVVNLDGCVISQIARSARKHGYALIMALNGYCGKMKSSFSSRPEIMRTIICHFVRTIMFAGLPSVFNPVPDKEDHEVMTGSESEEEEEEEHCDADQRDSGYHSGATTSQAYEREADEESLGVESDSFHGLLVQLSKKDLQSEPTEEDLDDVAWQITQQWKSVGRKLKVSQAKIASINENNVLYPNTEEKAFQMLNAWCDRGGATYGELLRVLKAINNR